MGVVGRKVSNMKNMNKAKRKESHNTPTPLRDYLCTRVPKVTYYPGTYETTITAVSVCKALSL